MAKLSVDLDRSPYVTVTKGMRGWFAVLVCWSDEGGEGLWEPYATHENSHPSRAGAEEDAKNWALNEEVRYIP